MKLLPKSTVIHLLIAFSLSSAASSARADRIIDDETGTDDACRSTEDVRELQEPRRV